MTAPLKDIVDALLLMDTSGLDGQFEVRGAIINRVKGGYSGSNVCRVALNGEGSCLKVAQDAEVANREWTIWTTLQEERVACVPSPLFRSGDRHEASAMTWCDGQPLGNVPLNDEQVVGLADALRSFGSAAIADLPAA